MSIFVCMMVKDEADIICQNIRHHISEGVDHFIVADNNSTDGTTEHLREFERGGVLTYVEDPDPAYRQADKTNRLIHRAGALGADWVLCVDADELWYGVEGRLSEVLVNDIPQVQWVEGYYHVPHADDDPNEDDPIKRITHRREGRDCPQSKVCFRYHRAASIHPGNHDVNHPGSRGQGVVAFREFQYRSFEHFVRKVRNGKKAYDAAPDLHPLLGIHWRRLGALSDEELEQEWQDYLSTPTIYDPAPVRDLVR